MGLAFPSRYRFSRDYGSQVRTLELRVERCLTGHAPTAVLMSRACPAILADAQSAFECFKMLKAAGVGAFTEFLEDRVASTPESSATFRR
jgi:hypothetical protein